MLALLVKQMQRCHCISVVLLPCVCYATGNDLTKWSIKRWWFNGQWYNTINDLINSWNADHKGVRSSFKLLKPGMRQDQMSAKETGHWTAGLWLPAEHVETAQQCL